MCKFNPFSGMSPSLSLRLRLALSLGLYSSSLLVPAGFALTPAEV